jgi:beta-glucosidase
MWPFSLGFAALNDPKLTQRFADIVRQEYLAVGIRESLSPQADLATEPRWPRIDGTFGEDPDIARKMVNAYVVGMQHGSDGLNSESVAVVVKHWVGYGAAKDGWDSHNYYGRYAPVSGPNLELHVVPFIGAFEANVSAVMPTYSILEGLTLDGQPVEQVGVGFNSQLLGLMRQKYGFRGLILSDWGITNPCPDNCRNGAPPGMRPAPEDIGMPWGVENLTTSQRFAKTINAGVDQIGGSEQSEIIVENAHTGAISPARVREAAIKILRQKFDLGLFEQPYVDEARAGTIAGNAGFVHEGETAQAKSVVLLQNNKVASAGKPLLPVTPKGKKVYLFGIDVKAAEAVGFQVVTQPRDADFAIIRAPGAYESEHTNYFFGSRQHEGRLWYMEKDPAYAEFLRASALVSTVFVTMLDRPLVLENVVSHSTALLGTFGIADAPLLRIITGQIVPGGHLPFELPSSREAVGQQKSDLPHDSKSPLFAFGFGLAY